MVLNVVVGALCVLVIVAAICRIDQMQWRGSHPGWVVFYVAAAYVAGAVLVDLPYDARDKSDVASVWILAFYMWLTRHHWRYGAPRFTSNTAEGNHGQSR